jgi:predicted Mrr-cat superfamily restriction endonuclease
MATWIVRAGSEDEYLAECLSSGFVAIGWQEVRRQTPIKDIDFNDIYHKLQEIYPSDSNHTIGAYTSQIHAFANKIYGGDFVLYSVKRPTIVAKETYYRLLQSPLYGGDFESEVYMYTSAAVLVIPLVYL